MAKEDVAVVWTNNVNVASLPKQLQIKYGKFKESARATQEFRDEFDDAFKDHVRNSGEVDIADDQSVRVNHRFGLAFGIADEPERERKARGSSGFSFGSGRGSEANSTTGRKRR